MHIPHLLFFIIYSKCRSNTGRKLVNNKIYCWILKWLCLWDVNYLVLTFILSSTFVWKTTVGKWQHLCNARSYALGFQQTEKYYLPSYLVAVSFLWKLSESGWFTSETLFFKSINQFNKISKFCCLQSILNVDRRCIMFMQFQLQQDVQYTYLSKLKVI